MPLPLGNTPVWSNRKDSNPRPADYKSAALPTELRQHGCRGGTRTHVDRLMRPDWCHLQSPYNMVSRFCPEGLGQRRGLLLRRGNTARCAVSPTVRIQRMRKEVWATRKPHWSRWWDLHPHPRWKRGGRKSFPVFANAPHRHKAHPFTTVRVRSYLSTHPRDDGAGLWRELEASIPRHRD